MNEPSEIARLRATLSAHCQRWRQLTEAEGIAISAGQWARVDSVQTTKQQLQSLIEGTWRDLRAACQACGRAAQGIEQEFRMVVEELLASEARNKQRVVDRRTQAAAEEQRLQQAVQKLHQIRGAYALSQRAVWESYV